jgi:hypothetical protein
VECPIAADWENTWRDCTHRVCYIDEKGYHFVSPDLDFRREYEAFVAIAKEVGREISEHSDDERLRDFLDEWADDDQPHFWLTGFDDFASEEATVDARDVTCVFAKNAEAAVAALREQLRAAAAAAEGLRIFGAAHREDLGMLDRLLAAGVEIDTTDAQGDTILTYAARERLEGVVEFALSRGADANHRDRDGLVAAELLELARTRHQAQLAAEQQKELERRQATEPPAHLIGVQRDLSAVRDRMHTYAATQRAHRPSFGGMAAAWGQGYAQGRARAVEAAAHRLGTDVAEA